ncbi:DUF2789 domain-containing protein [Motiliproteus sediminis]|uniref:DUF2789 domain-containing protein n=1 Tax=Motiliproteus sediminis TaxID=1468178 RepID=UPI001AEF47B9|nr:DUF2789 domain-containing protein [Motiliproteus sediminis]
MDTSTHTLSTLFEQLGLPSDSHSIDEFIAHHRMKNSPEALQDHAYWSPSQARFIAEALEQDSDWTEVVDELNTRLHS